MHMASMEERKSRTLFVRNLPFTCTNEKLAEAFEQVGPIKTSFVVGHRDSKKCKGYGFVQFSMLEDAVKALETVTQCDGRKINLSFADAKKKLGKKPKKAAVLGDDEVEEVQDNANAEDAPAAEKKQKKEKSPTKMTPKPPKQPSVKRCRLIIRNLSFKCKEADLKKQFEKFGEISEIALPLKNGTQSRGFAFIQFTQLHGAQKAVAEMNAKNIMGRPVAVDWAVAKDRFEASAKQDSDKDSGVSGDEGEVDKTEEKKKKKKKEVSSEEEENISDSEEEEEEDDDEESEEEDDGSEDDDDINESEDDDDSDEESEDEDSAAKPEKKPVIQRKSDVEEGRTMFVRNIIFEAEAEDVEEAFQEFGETSYVRMVFDKVTGQPRGTAFVQFKTKESADKCLAKAQDESRNGGILIHGRKLLVVLAVSKSEAQGQQVAKNTKEEKDNRNLFLAREGLIRAGTQAAVGLSQEDIKKRMKVEQVKREKLKNMNIFVSSTRLCVHNLPTKVNENELRKIMKQTVDDPAMKMTECRVMRNMDRTNQKGVSKSLGYAFVNFSQHDHALKALKELNNSTVFGENKRPIVEFSLENRKALEAKEKRLEKSKVNAQKRKAEEENKGNSTEGSPAKKKPKVVKQKLDKTQDKIAKSMHTGPKGMPKRMGPKIRHRNRGKGDNPSVNKKAKKGKKFQQNQQQKQPKPKMMKKKKKDGEVTDRVDKLIQKHAAKKGRYFNMS
ncbi:RNA-binding protein 28-like isoform X2 [Littorina saxatilis]|uniref:RNA-binding protein 28-like isoform X2 n=1 Tax=Littorina saxatilis TaxID=31220 RepID=UPI0038B59330